MIVLLLSIIFSSYLVFCFKYFARFGIASLDGIAVNYITCVIMGIVVTKALPNIEWIHRSWFPVAVYLGCSFFCIFNLMAYAARNIGVTMTSVASKLSMAIPVSAAIIFYDQPLTVIKAIAIFLAIVAVVFTSERSQDDSIKNSSKPLLALKTSFTHKKTFGVLLALLIFIGSGLNDSLINYASEKLMQGNDVNQF